MDILNRKILILGSNGMLGHMVKKYLEQRYEIETINHRWPSDEFKTAIKKSNSNFLLIVLVQFHKELKISQLTGKYLNGLTKTLMVI